MERLFSRYAGVTFVFLLGLGLGVLGCPGWGSSEWLKDSNSHDSLEEKLRSLLSTGMDQSKDPHDLRRLASLYLDLGYGVYS